MRLTRLTELEARELTREIVQQVAQEQPGMPDEGDPLTIDGDRLRAIVLDLLEAWQLIGKEQKP